MQPAIYQSPQTYPWFKPLVVVIVALLVLIVGGVWIYNARVFHVVGTNPSLKSVPAYYPELKINFNKELIANGLSVKMSDGIKTTQVVAGKSLIVDFGTTLTVGKTYTITVASVRSDSGDVLTRKLLRFTARDIPTSKLSAAQKQTILKQQDNYPYTISAINFMGFDALLDYGLTADQLQNVEDSLYGFSNQINQQFRTMTLVDGSIQSHIHNASVGDFTDKTLFQVKLGDTTYNAQLDSDIISGSVHTLLFDADGTQVYDSLDAHD